MRIFVTGATGVVGRRLVPLLIAAGHEVTGVARSRSKAGELERLGATPVGLDLLHEQSVRTAVSGQRVVVNLATRIPPSSKAFFPPAWRENDRIRSHASVNLVNAALRAGCERFVQESVSLIYPDSGDRWITEDDPLDPPSYARTVLDAEAQARRFMEAGRTGVVLRFALFYGWDSGHTVDTIRFVRKGIAPTFGSPDSYVSSISTEDAASAVLAALGIAAGVYNVSDEEPVRRREHYDSLARALGVASPKLPPPWMKYLGGSLGRTIARSQRISSERFRRASGWAPRFRSVRDGWPSVCRKVGGMEEPPPSTAEARTGR